MRTVESDKQQKSMKQVHLPLRSENLSESNNEKRGARIKGCIFDLDGTLLDSLDLRIKAWKKAFDHEGIPSGPDQIRPLIGIPGKDLVMKIGGDPEKIEMLQEENFSHYRDEVHYFEDVYPTVRELEKFGLRLCIVTSSRKSMLEKMDLPVQDYVCIDDVVRGKPDSEPYEKALEKIRLRGEEVMVIGDVETDMIPARSLGSVAVLVRHGRDTHSEFADFYIDNIGETLPLIKHINRTGQP